jgi:hypothetical protein
MTSIPALNRDITTSARPVPLIDVTEGSRAPMAVLAGVTTVRTAVPYLAIYGTPAAVGGRPGQPVPETSPETACRAASNGTVAMTVSFGPTMTPGFMWPHLATL